MAYKVDVITGTRADYGLLRELLFRLKADERIRLELLVTGSHLCEGFGNTQQEILGDGFEYIRIPIPIEDDTKGGMAYSTGVAICRFAEHFSHNPPNILIVLGDRYEILAGVIAARMQGIPVAHISGGDVTEGVIDDSIRHSITKMSQLHFAGCEQSRKRIIQMGEDPHTVFNVGEPGVENCLKLQLINRDELASSLSFDGVLGDYSIVTFHPVTLQKDIGIDQIRELIKAMDEFKEMNYIVTMANADAGGRSINKLWLEEGKKRSNWLVIKSLGVHRYISAMHYAKAVIGNSSSGIVEAPSMRVATVNIGDRQKGRMMAESIISCDPSWTSIKNAIATAISDEFVYKVKNVKSPFGDGSTSQRIFKELLCYLDNSNLRENSKKFYDLNFM